MLRWLLRRTVSAFERQWNYDAGYLRDIVDASPRAAWRFFNAARLGNYRRDVPLEALTAAALTAVRSEDCGPCTQLGTAMAERQGVRPEVLRAILRDDVDAMPADVALAWRFTKAVLAFAITTARIYPTVKYAMGHGKACIRVVVGGTPVVMDREPAANSWGVPGQSHATRSA